MVPAVLTGWQVAGPVQRLWPLRLAGLAMTVTAAIVLIGAFGRVVAEGNGTPAPVAPTETLVVGGLSRWVRNPMYLAVVAAIAGRALLLGRLALAAYGLAIWVIVAAFVRWYEEPTLARRYGPAYLAYRAPVPPWHPRKPRHTNPALKRERR